jgi:hypothetical protein
VAARGKVGLDTPGRIVCPSLNSILGVINVLVKVITSKLNKIEINIFAIRQGMWHIGLQ